MDREICPLILLFYALILGLYYTNSYKSVFLCFWMIVVDVETTGLDAKKNAICSIGAFYLFRPEHAKFFIAEKQFYAELRVPNDAEIADRALEINGFDRNELRSPSRTNPEKGIREFIAFAEPCHDRTIAGENPRFDLDFLRATAQKYNVDFHSGYRTRDLHTTCSDTHDRLDITIPLKDGRTDIDLDYTLRFIGLPPEPKPHNGLTGAKLEAEAISRLIFGKNLFPEYQHYKVPEYLQV